MNSEWSLDSLYTGYDDPAYLADDARADELIRAINDFAGSLSIRTDRENLFGALRLFEESTALFQKLGAYSFLRQAANTSDAQSVSRMGRILQQKSEIAAANTQIMRHIAAMEAAEALLAEDSGFSQYEYFLRNLKENARYMLSPDVEAALAKYDMSGGSAWTDLQAYLTSTVKVDYKGEAVTLSAIRNLAYDPDPTVRKSAYEAELAGYEKIKDAVAYSLNSIKMQALSECALRGHSSILDKALHSAHMRRETLDALIAAMEEHMSIFRDYLKAKGRALGHANGLPWYDMFAPMGKSDRRFTVEEARDYLLDIFGKFNPGMAEVIRRAFDEAWIDFYPRPAKTGGAFCDSLACMKEFRVLSNFSGSFGDVSTLAHELGHGYHDFMVHDNGPLNWDYSMPVAETASTFNELLLSSTALGEAQDDAEKLAILDGELMEATQIICDIYSRFLFESALCQRRTDSFMFPDELCAMMLEAQKKAYGDGLAPETLHPYMWLCKPHYYSADLGFYNFPYAFGGLFARGLYAKYLQEGKDFLPKYDAMLKNTPMCSVEDAAKLCNIDITSKDFWCMSLKSCQDAMEQYKALTI